MEKVVYNPIMDKNYIGIVTVLDYETSVRKCLSSVLVGTQNRMERKVIVDLALKVGVNEYRFVVHATKAVLFLPTCAIQPVFCSLFLMRIRRKTFLLKQKA